MATKTLEEILARIQELKQENEDKDEVIREQLLQIEEIDARKNELSSAISDVTAQNNDLQARVEELEARNLELEAKLQDLNEVAASADSIVEKLCAALD